MSYLKSINPYSTELLEKHKIDSDAAIAAKVNELNNSFKYWSELSLKERSTYLSHIAGYLEDEKEIREEMIKAGIAVASNEIANPCITLVPCPVVDELATLLTGLKLVLV